MAEVVALRHECVVYRALRPSWLVNVSDGGESILVEAFLRKDSDNDGLSVSNGDLCDVAFAAARLRKCKAVAKLIVRRVREINGVDAVGSPEENDPSHAIITGLPFNSRDPFQSEILASQLRERSEIRKP